VELGAELGERNLAERYYQAYLRLNPRDRFADGIRLAHALLDPTKRGTPEVRKALDTMSADGLFAAYWPLFSSADATTPILPVAQAIAQGRPGRSPLWKDEGFRRWLLASPLMQRGRYREAVTVEGSRSRWVMGLAALAGVQPSDSAAPAFQEMLRVRSLNELRAAGGPTFWAAMGDTASLKILGRAIDSTSKVATGGSRTASLSAFSQSTQAYQALARRDTAEALRRFVALSDTLCPECVGEHLQKARLLALAGRDHEAADVLGGGLHSYSPWYVWVALERARVADRLGERDRAVEGFQLVTSRWFKADPELQPFVEEARRALERLSAEPRTHN
jgi:hypothetical protein